MNNRPGRRSSALLQTPSIGALVIALAVFALTRSADVDMRVYAQSACGASINPIACENQQPGDPDTQWDVVGAGDPTIQGFATEFSVVPGQTQNFKISTSATAYGIDIYRMGYYSGAGARKVATIAPTAALPQTQPACLSDAATGLVDCGNWAVSASWPVPADAVSGIYFAKLTRGDTAGASHVVFVVRESAGAAHHSQVLFQTSDTTWQARNQYGGNSLYVGGPVGRAYKVSYNRPFTTRGTNPEDWVFNAEYPMVRWLEANGYDVSYMSGIDTDRFGATTLTPANHKVFLSVGRDEYWSAAQRANVEAARGAGLHLAFFSGSEIFWKSRWEPSIDGANTPYRTLVSYRETLANAVIDPLDPSIWTGTWRDPRFSPPADGGKPENALTGQLFLAVDEAQIEVPAALGKMRFWRNTSVATLGAGQTATMPAGTLGSAWDVDVDNGFRPNGLIHLSSTTKTFVQKLIDYGTSYSPATVTHSLTLYRHSSGAMVFGAGTVQWSWGLDAKHDRGNEPADVRMKQATVNLLADMGVQPGTLEAGLTPASPGTDVLAATTVLTSPTPGTSLMVGTTVAIAGTAVDNGGGHVAGVEVSVDGGTTWQRASGTNNWSYVWTVAGSGSASIKSRAYDDSGNMEVASAGVTLAVTGTPGSTPLTGGPGGPILIVSSTTNPFTQYYAEILRAEGLNAFAMLDVTAVTPATLTAYDVVILGEMALTAPQTTMFVDWVTAGGNLIAMRPDKQLASLLGLTDAASMLSEAYLQVDTGAAPGTGIVGQTMQFHGTADRYTTAGATAVATLYATASTATANPAVTIRNVGGAGGQAAAFTYDLARSIVYTRQGNPAWSGQERDGQLPIRPDDLFFGAKAGDVQPDWVDLTKVAIPQADEQQRLLANLIAFVNADRKPLPKFWYFPRGEKAVVVMTGDDHGNNGTAGRFDIYNNNSPVGCSVVDWDCVRATSYIFSSTPISDAAASTYTGQGFEIAAHVTTLSENYTPASLEQSFTTDFANFAATFPSLPASRTNRTHAVVWSDYDTQSQVEQNHGIGLDTTYYYWPAAWVQNIPGMFTGSGMPMRFAKVDGSMVDVYQAATQMTDESGQTYPFNVDTLLDRALGPLGYYGAFVANMHTDIADHAGSAAIVASAQARGVPIVSSRQLLDWVNGRNSSTFTNIARNGGTLTFTVAPGPGANGLRAMLPVIASGGAILTTLTRDGAPLSYSVDTIKGVSYAMFSAVAGAYEAVYVVDATPPVISALTATPAVAAATITWTTNEFASSQVNFGTNPDALTSSATGSSGTNHTVSLTSLIPGATYHYRVTSTDLSGNAAVAPEPPAAPGSFIVGTVSCPCSIWAPSTVPATESFADFSAIELGLKFRTTISGFITGVRFYKGPANTGTHVGHLWRLDGTSLGVVNFSGETATGWQEATFAAPVAVSANTTYVVSYHTDAGGYAVDASYFATSGVTNGPLQALASGVDGANGVYRYGGVAFPTDASNGHNFWVDVVFSAAADTTAPTVTGIVPANGATSVSPATAVTATFSEAMDAATITTNTVELRDPANALVPATVTYGAGTQAATLQPTSALAIGTTYTVRVIGGIAGVKDVAGNALASTVTTTFTTAVPDTTPPTVTGIAPANGATNVNPLSEVTATFSEAMNATTIGTSTVELRDASDVLVPATVTYSSGTHAATVQPTSALAAAAVYTLRVIGGAAGVKDVAGNALAATVTSSFTTADTSGGSCPCSIWPPSAVPATESFADFSAIEVGLKFRTTTSGVITGVRFYKGPANTGTHVGHVWTLGGTSLGVVTFSGETATGWQEATFATPVPVSANTTYVVSYHTDAGGYAVNAGYFASAGVTSGPLQALATGVDGANGVYRYGGAAFPTDPSSGHNFWVDVVFSAVVDNTPPAVTGVVPANGATDVSATTAVTASFSEAIDASTITASTVELRDASNVLVPANVTYSVAAQAAILQPTSALAFGASYTARVVGGPSGVKDVAGNALAVDFVSTFTTGVPDTTPPTVTGIVPANGATNVSPATTVTVTFSEAMNATTVTTSTVELRDATTALVPSTVTYNGGTQTATLQPASVLAGGSSYTARVISGASGVKDVAGNALVADAVATFTTTVPDTTPPTVTGMVPVNGAINVSPATTVTATFSEPMNAATITTSTVELRDASNTLVPSTVSYNSGTLTAVLQPIGGLASPAFYTARVIGGPAGVKDLSGNALATTVTASFTTAETPCPCSIWPPNAVPANESFADFSAIEVGLKFRTTIDGVVMGIRFYKGPANTGTHVGHLWHADGTSLGTVTFSGETATGWQEAILSAPVPVSANTTYVVSYHAETGGYAANPGYFATSGLTNGPLLALATGVDGANGVYRYGGPAFPTDPSSGHNFWVDVIFAAVDLLPPTVTAVTPPNGATNVNPATAVAVTFNEGMDAATITANTVELRDAANVLVPATVTYTAGTRTATLQPAGALDAAGQTYAIRVVGGVSGVTDVEGNPLTADVTSTFRTADSVAPSVTTSTPVNGATGVLGTTAVSVTFSEALDVATITGSTFVLLDAVNAPVLATVTYNSGSQTATLQPTSALGSSATYTARVTGGGSGVKDVAGNALAVDFVSTFTILDTVAPTVSGVAPADAATGVAATTAVTVTFSEDMDAATVSTGTIELRDAANVLVPATVTYNVGPHTATVQPLSTLDIAGQTYTVRVVGGSAGVKDLVGNALVADVTSSFTTADTLLPSVIAFTPANGSLGVPREAVTAVVTFSENVNPATVTTSTVEIRDPAGSVVPATVSYNSTTRTATLQPLGLLAPAATHTLRVVGGAGGVKDLAGNPLLVEVVATFTTSGPPAVGVSAKGRYGDETPDSATTSPVTTRPTTNLVVYVHGEGGTITSPTVTDSYNNTWTLRGVQRTSVWPAYLWVFTSFNAAGGPGHTVTASKPGSYPTILATEIIGTNVAVSGIAMDIDNVSPFTTPVLQVTTDALLLGAFAPGFPEEFVGILPSEGFGTVMEEPEGDGAWVVSLASRPVAPGSYSASWTKVGGANDFDFGVSLMALTGTPVIDVTQPTVTELLPANGGALSTQASVTASFSESMDPASINAATVELRDSQNALVPAAVTYDATTRRALLKPAAELLPSATYVAKVVGGATGVKDLAGNPLPSTVTGTFTALLVPSVGVTAKGRYGDDSVGFAVTRKATTQASTNLVVYVHGEGGDSGYPILTDTYNNTWIPWSVQQTSSWPGYLWVFVSFDAHGGPGHQIMAEKPNSFPTILSVEAIGSAVGVQDSAMGIDNVSPFTTAALPAPTGALLLGAFAPSYPAELIAIAPGNGFKTEVEEPRGDGSWVASVASRTVTPGTYSASWTKTGGIDDPNFAVGLLALTRGTGFALSISDATVSEATATATFTVQLTGSVGQPVSVSYATASGTASSADFTSTSGTLSFSGGVLVRTVTVPIVSDLLNEANESFVVNLSNPVNANITDAQGVGIIVDDDPAPAISVSDVSVTEGNTGSPSATFVVSLSAPSGQTVTVNYASANGTAVAPGDYTAANGLVTFAPGVISQSVAITLVADTVAEPGEAFSLQLSNPTNATITDGTAVATIVNDDATTAIFAIAAGGDDVTQDGTALTTGATTVWLGNGISATSSYTGLRFTGVSIPRNAVVTSAKLEVISSAAQWIPMALEFGIEASSSAAVFATGNLPSQRTLLAPRVNHSSNVLWALNSVQQLDEIAPIVQALVTRPDWTAGNALALIMRGTDTAFSRKFIRSFESAAANAPKLIVTYVGQ